MESLQSYLTLYSYFLKDRFVRINLFLAGGLNIILWLWLFWQTKDFSGHIALHYNIYFGIDLLGSWFNLFYLPALGLAIFLFNLAIGAISFEREKMLGYFLVGVATLNQILLLLAAFFVVFINK